MKTTQKKAIVYVIFFAYIVICSVILFLRPDIKIRNDILFYFIFIVLFPGLFISFLFGFFGGTKWAIIGIGLTVLVTVFIIERVFKQQELSQK